MDRSPPRDPTVIIFPKRWHDALAIEKSCLEKGWKRIPGTPEDHKIRIVKSPGAQPEFITASLEDDIQSVMNALEDRGWKIDYRISPALEFAVPKGTEEACAAAMRKDMRVAQAQVFDPDGSW